MAHTAPDWATATVPGQGQAGGSLRSGRWAPQVKQVGFGCRKVTLCLPGSCAGAQPASRGCLALPSAGLAAGLVTLVNRGQGPSSAKEALGKMIREIQGEQTKGRTTWVQTLQETPSADQVRHGWQHHACKGWNHVREGTRVTQEGEPSLGWGFCKCLRGAGLQQGLCPSDGLFLDCPSSP